MVRTKDNPWQRLPAQPPFVHPDDQTAVGKFNAQAAPALKLRVNDLLPEPFLGDPRAPVILLSNNPGMGKFVHLRQTSSFMRRMRDGICLKFSKYPFIYLDPEFAQVGYWWRQKLKSLLERFGAEVVARSICNIVYFPYPSDKFGHRRCELPSQQYSFDLVRSAVERGAVIVLMRKGQLRHWEAKVPELKDYRNYVVLRNPQMPAVSRFNCDPGDYDKVVHAIEGINV
jgi:hypothetical protein